MEVLQDWLKHNWHDFGELIGIFTGLFFTAIAWRLQYLETITQKHRALSMWIAEHPEVHRIYSKDAKISEQPLNVAELKALNMIFVQYETGWDTARFLDCKRLEPLANDIRSFFPLPLVRSAWSEAESCHAKGFQRFVKRAIDPKRPG